MDVRWFDFPCAMLTLLFLSLCFHPVAARAGDGAVYTATVIPAVAQSEGSTTVRIQVAAYTSDAERAQLKEVFSKEGSEKGLALLRTMSKGYINIAGAPGRKIMAAFLQGGSSGKRLILITEHVLSIYEKTQGAKAEDFPLTIIHIQFDAMGTAQGGKVYPAAKVSITPDGFLDVTTDTPNTATMIDIVRTD